MPVEKELKYRPLTARRRWLIAGLAVATAVTVVLTLLSPPGGVQRTRPAASSACAPGQTDHCVGGTSAVITPRPSPTPGPAAAASR